MLLQDWLCSAHLADSLLFLHAGGFVDWETFTEFIAGLGASPALHTLRMFIELTEEERESLDQLLDGNLLQRLFI